MVVDISHLEYHEALQSLSECIENFERIDSTILFRADHSQSKILRDWIALIFDANHIESLWKGRFVLITDELTNNAIEHGSRPGDINECHIIATAEENEWSIEIQISDNGKGKDSAGAEHLIEVQKEKEGMEGVYIGKRGRGLFFITSKLVDLLEFTDNTRGGLTVTIRKTLQKTQPTQETQKTE